MLITGGAGFIGTNTIRQLLATGQQVTVLDNFATGYRANLADILDSITLIEGSVDDAHVLASAMQGQDVVLHLAAIGSVPRSFKEPLVSHGANATGFLQVLQTCINLGVKRLVYASSSSVYGDHPALPKTEADTGNILSPYAATKALNEAYARTLGPFYGLQTVGLRFFNVFGPYQSPGGAYAAAIPKFMAAANAGQPLEIYGDGSQTRDFTYINNVVQVLLKATTAELSLGQALVCNVGCGERITLTEVAQTIVQTAGSHSPIVHVPERTGDIKHSLADITRAKLVLGYAPTISVREGLALAYRWYADNPTFYANL